MKISGAISGAGLMLMESSGFVMHMVCMWDQSQTRISIRIWIKKSEFAYELENSLKSNY